MCVCVFGSDSFGGQVANFHYSYTSLPPSRELKLRLDNHCRSHTHTHTLHRRKEDYRRSMCECVEGGEDRLIEGKFNKYQSVKQYRQVLKLKLHT